MRHRRQNDVGLVGNDVIREGPSQKGQPERWQNGRGRTLVGLHREGVQSQLLILVEEVAVSTDRQANLQVLAAGEAFGEFQRKLRSTATSTPVPPQYSRYVVVFRHTPGVLGMHDAMLEAGRSRCNPTQVGYHVDVPGGSWSDAASSPVQSAGTGTYPTCP